MNILRHKEQQEMIRWKLNNTVFEKQMHLPLSQLQLLDKAKIIYIQVTKFEVKKYRIIQSEFYGILNY